MSDAAIQDALCAALQDGDLDAPIAWPFVKYTPTIGVAYFQVMPLLKSKVQRLGISFDVGANVNRGIFQVDAVIADGAGEKAALQMTDQIRAIFPYGTQLVTTDGQRLQVADVPQTASPVTDAPWERYPVSIPYVLID